MSRFRTLPARPMHGAWVLLGLVLAATLLASRPVHGQSTEYAALVERGDEAFASFRNADAVAAYAEAMRLTDHPPFELLARLSRTYNDYGMDLVAEGDDEGGREMLSTAIEFAERLREEHPDRAETWFLLAAGYGNMALFEGGRGKVRTGRAVEEYCSKAIELDPMFAPPYAVLGIYYREVAELNWIQRALAKTLFGGLPSGTREGSEAMLREAIELDPQLPLAHFELARTLISMDRSRDAEPYLESAVALDPVSTLDLRNAVVARELLEDL